MPAPLVLPVHFTEKLRLARYYALQTQGEVAQDIGYYGKQSWWRIEHGHKGISLKRLCDCAALYRVRVHYLIDDAIPHDEYRRYSYTHTPPTTSIRQLGGKIRLLREMHHKTQADVADAIEITQVSYSRIERGERKPSIARLLRIAEAYGVTTDYLLYDSIPYGDYALVL